MTDPYATRLLRAAAICALTAVLILVVSVACHAQEGEPRSTRTLTAILTTYAVASSIDVAQTAGCINAGTCREVNPAMRELVKRPGAFTAVKAAATTAVVVGVWRMRQRHPKIAVGLAAVLAAVQVGAVVHNARQLRGGR